MPIPIEWPFPIEWQLPVEMQQQRPMPVRQWIAKILKHFKNKIPPKIAAQIALRFPSVLPYGLHQSYHQSYPLGLEYPLQSAPNFPGYPIPLSPEYQLHNPIFQSYPQPILPYLPHAMNENMMNETEKTKFKFWRPFSGIRDKFKKFFNRNKKGNETQNQGIKRQRELPQFISFELQNNFHIYQIQLNSSDCSLLGYDVGYEEWNGMSDGGGSSKKEMTLRNIYDIALIAIAYLSFGLFVLQVIMCITLVMHPIFTVAPKSIKYFPSNCRRKRMRVCQ